MYQSHFLGNPYTHAVENFVSLMSEVHVGNIHNAPITDITVYLKNDT